MDHRQTYVDLLIPRMNLQMLRYDRLLHADELVMRAATMEDVTLHASLDRGKEKHPDFVPIMPNTLLQDIPFYLKIDFVGVQNMNITYAEKVENNNVKPGEDFI